VDEEARQNFQRALKQQQQNKKSTKTKKTK